MEQLNKAYNQYYAEEKRLHVYPVEFVVRTFLGKYPNLRLEQAEFAGKRILDLGYGDGRNMPLLFNLGFDIAGVEITDEINRLAEARLATLGIPAVLKTGHNSRIPFADKFFHYVLACHACYYVNEGESFADNLKEINRVLDSQGMFVCSLPFNDTYILQGAEKLSNGHYRIQHDPYGLRNGTIFRAFANEDEVEQELSEYFTDFRIGFCDDNFYGIHQKVWIVTCWKKQ